ncbi:MAG TPA: ATP-binding cassette domain-containing protein [Chlamydiales bacterium]|nr:ATP-binding cassette domain-containing protein [Chlamydiales bacterium]
MYPVIHVDKLSKTFVVRRNYPGIWGALRGLFYSQKSEIVAIDQISFSIQAGERVAFIGPNGAGKSTTIKMLTGILHPTSGEVKVLGLVPWKDRQTLGYKIGTVFGQRTQLWHHLPPSDTFALLSKIYELDVLTYKQRLNELVDVFEIRPFFDKPVRQLSLGERMRCELVASLLHRPEILFLDEPTIGLDINAKLKIRGLLNQLSREYGTTLFLTSHDTADIEQVCERVIVLDRGTIILDSSLRELKKTYIKKKILTLTTDAERISLNLPGIQILENDSHHFVCEINLEKIPIDRVIHEALKVTSLKDVTIEEPSMEEIIRTLYG